MGKDKKNNLSKPSKEEAIEAVRTLIRWAGDDPSRGVAVVIDAQHQCMTTRGVHKPGTSAITSRMLGAFRTDSNTRREFLSIIQRQDSDGLMV